MKGHFPTPMSIVDLMVAKLFESRPPKPQDLLLDPGCGRGEFIDGVLRWCDARNLPPPVIIGVENDPRHSGPAHSRFMGRPEVKIRRRDFLTPDRNRYDFIVGNPPYVPITGLDLTERARYRQQFSTAVERFDLYALFFEQCLRLMAPNGWLCLITPEKFEYTHSTAPLRRLLANYVVGELHHLDEETFPGLVTYPTITTIQNRPPTPTDRTLVILRDGTSLHVRLPTDGSSWNPLLHPHPPVVHSDSKLVDICERVSCGIATGADSLFVHPNDSVPPTLRVFAFPTLAGRQLGLHGPDEFRSTSVMLVPYDRTGRLMLEDDLGDLLTFLSRPDIARRLRGRTCVAGGRAWYRFHDNAPLDEILKPKILTKDITSEPHFWADREGTIVPRHSMYYIVPKRGVLLENLLEYLNGPVASGWLKANCQHAANGFFRVQSTVLKQLPIPEDLARQAMHGPLPAGRKAPRRKPQQEGHKQAILHV